MTSDALNSRNCIHVFVDLSNFELTMRDASGSRFLFDWEALPGWLVGEAARVAGLSSAEYAGAHVYASYDPADPGSERFRRWLSSWLDMQPGVQVDVRARRPRQPPRCPRCLDEVAACPSCGSLLRGSQEKGVDTAIVTDMIRLAWEDAYDIAVLVSSDSDFIPAVQFLGQRGLKVIQAGFPQAGHALKGPCRANIDLFARRSEFERRQPSH